MSRIKYAGRLLRPLDVSSVLDIGCRDGSLADEIPDTYYSGADIVPDKRGLVKYLGDVTKIDLPDRFDAVVALDILEHLAHPSAFFDRIVEMSDRIILVSLPNTYDLKSRARFALQGRISGKYVFSEQEPCDRHHWVMNHTEVVAFFEAKAKKHGLSLEVDYMTYGASGQMSLSSVAGRVASSLLPASLATETILGLFRKL